GRPAGPAARLLPGPRAEPARDRRGQRARACGRSIEPSRRQPPCHALRRCAPDGYDRAAMTTPPSLRPLDGRYSLAGEPRPPVPEATLEVCSPVDGSVVGRVHEYTHSEIDAVVGGAARAQPARAHAA